MSKGYVIYNPLAGNGNAEEEAKLLQMVLDEDLEYYDMTRITNYKVFLSNLSTDDYLVIVGGDGTLNRFVNDTDGLEITKEILYFPAGSGNDFARELGTDGNPVVITQYLNNLPSVEVNGRRYRFINGVGFGIDGYCCQVGDELKKTPGKKVNYAAIAIVMAMHCRCDPDLFIGIFFSVHGNLCVSGSKVEQQSLYGNGSIVDLLTRRFL